MVPPLEEHLERCKELVAKVGESLEPDGDWVPVLLGWDLTSPVFVGLSGTSDELFASLPAIVAQTRMVLGCLVLSSWSVMLRPEQVPGFQVRPSEHPDRTEVLVLCGSDGQRELTWVAPIERDGTKVSLGTWEKVEEAGGRFPDRLRQAIAANDSGSKDRLN